MLHPVNVAGFIQMNDEIATQSVDSCRGEESFVPTPANLWLMTPYPRSISTREFTSVNLEL
jgi:hypothetical protein